MPSRPLHQGAALLHSRKGVQHFGRDLRLRGARVPRPLQVIQVTGGTCAGALRVSPPAATGNGCIKNTLRLAPHWLTHPEDITPGHPVDS